MSGEGELMLTILASYAQEESRSVSDNCKWRIRKRFKNGEVVNLRFMYGYRIDQDGIVIEPDEAAVVRMIFEDYVGGLGCDRIARKLRGLDLPSMRNGVWTPKRVADIIKNEKYTGNAILQKKFVVDHMSKLLKRNKDHLPKYYAEQTHEAIVDLETFEKANAIMADRHVRNNVKQYSASRYPFSGLMVCGRCGKTYKRLTRRGKHTWNCSTYQKLGRDACYGKEIPEEMLNEIVCELLGINQLDEKIVRSRIKRICVPEVGVLCFELNNGRQIERTWTRKRVSKSGGKTE